MPLDPAAPIYFATAAEWREWLEVNHARKTDVAVKLYKRGSGQPCMTWSESVDEALCFGWIDAVRGAIDASCYSIRFTTRKAGSIWSNVNIAKAESLIAQGRMKAAGLAKFQARSAVRSGVYSFEQASVELDADSAAAFRANPAAWEFFQKQPASYRRKVIWLIVSAHRPETRRKRLAALMEASGQRQRL